MNTIHWAPEAPLEEPTSLVEDYNRSELSNLDVCDDDLVHEAHSHTAQGTVCASPRTMRIVGLRTNTAIFSKRLLAFRKGSAPQTALSHYKKKRLNTELQNGHRVFPAVISNNIKFHEGLRHSSSG
jgi:hypothetical protein